MEKAAKTLPELQLRLAENLRRMREERGIQQEKFAYESGVDRSYYWRIERADANPTLNVLCKMAELLEVDLTTLLADEVQGRAPATKNVRRKGPDSQKP